MSKPLKGKYYIVNKQPTSDGELLAITYNGEGVPLTVSKLGTQANQAWIFTDSVKELQAISPVEDTTEVVNFGENYTLRPVKTKGLPGPIWTIRTKEGICTIQDGDIRYFWGLKEVEDGKDVHFGRGIGNHDWWLMLY